MPVIALAFHGTVAISKLRLHYGSASAATLSASRTIFCSKCHLTFVAVLMNCADPRKEGRLEDLRNIIEEDCINGLHQEEYVLSEPE
jgi:hypothetical protein